ncbi:MAG: c-type cytochrome [Longimicrobiales bacterium]
MKWSRPLALGGLGIFTLAYATAFGACDRPMPEAEEGQDQLLSALASLTTPEVHRDGEALFTVGCVQCHGPLASGSELGPPLVHTVYRPAHHADAAFQLAVLRGVRAHHWGFGDMPPQPNVTSEMATAITGYVRWLQRQVGID